MAGAHRHPAAFEGVSATASAPFWNVDIGTTGVFTPVGGSDAVGIGPAISVAITRDQFHGEKDSNGAGVVGMFMTTSTVNQTAGARSREYWMLGGVRGNVWEDVGLLAFQAVGGVKSVRVADPLSGSLSQTNAAFGLGLSFNMPPVGQRVLIRAFDLVLDARRSSVVAPLLNWIWP